jgi:hypothetical protein
MQVKALREALRTHRLANRMAYDDLTEDIASVMGERYRLSVRTIRQFIEGSVQPLETTAYTVQQYLDKVRSTTAA